MAIDFDLRIAISCPPAAAFSMLADIQEHIHAPGSPVPEMEKIPPGPTAVGTRWREVVRLAPFLTMTMWTEVTAIEPDHLLATTFHGPWMRGTLRYTIDPIETGCVLRQRETLTPIGPLRLASGLMDRLLRPRVTARLGAIREKLEREAAAA
jgi:hypothetical protein